MSESIIRIGYGDSAGGDECLLVNSTIGWILIIPWGYDYGCGISKVIKLTEEEKEELSQFGDNKHIDGNKLLNKFHGRKDESE